MKEDKFNQLEKIKIIYKNFWLLKFEIFVQNYLRLYRRFNEVFKIFNGVSLNYGQ